MTPDPVSRLHAFFQQVWVEGDLGAVDRLCSQRFRACGVLAYGAIGFEDLKVMVPALRVLIDEPVFDWLEVFPLGRHAAARFVVRGIAPRGRKPVEVPGIVLLRVDDAGLIDEVSASFDFLSFFEQVGQLPKDAFALLIGGVKLA